MLLVAEAKLPPYLGRQLRRLRRRFAPLSPDLPI